jgi:3-carboxy-cis,cis-muconate cycloisomerase
VSVFASIAVPAGLRAAVSERAWLEAMLAAERALALAEARAGVIPAEAAEAIAAQCRPELFEWSALVARARSVGNPAEPLVAALREAVGGDAAAYVHYGATSQDVVDSAAMRVARDTLALVQTELDGVTALCAGLAREHRGTVAVARTLLQPAVPTTFGLRAAGWLAGVVDAQADLRRFVPAAQLGGAAGTLAALGDDGPEVARLYADELGLVDPGSPWQANRVPVARLGTALDLAAGALGKIGADLVLLSAFGEVQERDAGGSSTMPQKRNPVGATLARACALQVHGHAAVLAAAVAGELERPAGAWHAEWDALSAALALTGAAAAAVRGALDGLEVDAERMRANIPPDALAEAGRFGLEPAGPEDYLGSASAFVDRVLESYEAVRT